MRKTISTCFCTAFLALSFPCFAQHKAANAVLGHSIDWSDGSIMLNDGTELKGLVKYNDNTSILSYNVGDDYRSFTATSVVGFEYYDENTKAQRVFLTFPFEDPLTNITKPLFFEVIREFPTFVVLSKSDPIDVERKAIGYGDHYEYSSFGVPMPVSGVNVGSSLHLSKAETICIMDTKDGSIKPFVKIVEKEIDGVVFDRKKTKNKIVDKEALERCTGPHYKSLLTYARDNDLKFERKSDLMSILNFYAMIAK